MPFNSHNTRCPFCSSDDLRCAFNAGRSHWNIHCFNCHAIGPEARTSAGAWHKWNIRFTPSAENDLRGEFHYKGKLCTIKYPGFLAYELPAVEAEEETN